MPGFTLSAGCRAPVEEVWKLLFDPARFPDWWAGIETVRKDAPGEFTQWPTGYPDFPMPQKLRVDQASERVTISCQVSDIEVVWQLAEAGTGTSINVNVSLPEREAHRLDGQHQVIAESLRRLTALAEAASWSLPRRTHATQIQRMVMARQIPALRGEQPLEERAVKAQPLPEFFGGDLVAAGPAVFKFGALGGEHLGQPLHELCYEHVGFLGPLSRAHPRSPPGCPSSA